jgi:hypothetical protein
MTHLTAIPSFMLLPALAGCDIASGWTAQKTQSQSYLMTDGQATIRAHDQFFSLLEIFLNSCGFVTL